MRILSRLQAVGMLFFLIVCLPSAGLAAQAFPPSVIEALTRAGIPATAVGIYVQEVSGIQPPVTLNATTPLNPASTMKLLTTHAALELLGPAYKWRTRIYTNALRAGDVLLGDVIIKGEGDPKLVLERMWLLLRDLRNRGIREIRGNLLLDRSYFQTGTFDSALFDGDPLRPYNVGPDALLLNFKSAVFRFIPNDVTGIVGVVSDPPMEGYTVTGPRLTHDECGPWRNKMQPVFAGWNIVFTGTYSIACGEQSWALHPYHMTQNQYFEIVFRKLWRDLGGTLIGAVSAGEVPPEARMIAELESLPLSDIVRDINKFSNNVMARQLLLTLAANTFKQPANTELGEQVIRAWLTQKNIAAPGLVVENGAGLSRIERISAESLGRLLVAAFHAPTMPEFISSLPLAGQDGTMRQRLRERSAAGSAHIKTGSLVDVRAIAGYVLAASGKRYAIVFIINHSNAWSAGHPAQDALLQWVYEQG